MNEPSEFFNQLNHLRAKVHFSQDVSRLFRNDPVDTLRQYGLDFAMRDASGQILFSDYLERISPAARTVILGTIYQGRRRRRMRVDGDGGGDGGGDDGGDDGDDDDDTTVASMAVAVATVAVAVNAVAVANAIANANAVANANAMANANTVAVGAYDIDRDHRAHGIYVSRLSIDTPLYQRLEACGLNIYRQMAMLRHAARGCLGDNADQPKPGHMTFSYKDMQIELEIVVDPTGVSVASAGLRQSAD